MIELGFEFRAMAGPCTLHLAGDDETCLRRGADAAITEVRRIESKYSRYDAGSVVSRINAAAGSGLAVEVDDETNGLLDFAHRLHALSEGLFDITSGVLRRAWDFRTPRLPAAQEIDALLPLVGWPRVRRSGRSIALPLRGMEIDFGGFGKEYAADRAAACLLEAGVRHGYVNLGGDLRVLGPRPDGAAWPLAIRHPREAGAVVQTLQLAAGALATSGDYERFIEVDGMRYHHLLDPRSGWPVRHWQSVSVIAPTCSAAGAASTIAMLHGTAGVSFLERQGLAALLVGPAGELIRIGGA